MDGSFSVVRVQLDGLVVVLYGFLVFLVPVGDIPQLKVNLRVTHRLKSDGWGLWLGNGGTALGAEPSTIRKFGLALLANKYIRQLGNRSTTL